MEAEFRGRAAIVTGGGAGIGKAITQSLAAAGCRVAIFGTDGARNSAVAEEISARTGTAVLSCRCDVTDEATVRGAVAQAVKSFGKVDFLINNAGIYPAAPFLEMDTGLFSKVFDVNVKGIFHVTRETVRQSMKPNRFGKIISISSVDGWLPTAGILAYAASKAAVNSMVKSFAIELQEYNITSNGIAPGWVATETVMKSGRWKTQIGRVLKKRMADPSEIGDIVTVLCSEKADYLNGEVLNMSGGLLLNA